ncbi:MAG TPA: MMPL family transporter, partial [Chthoniobacteraceae bacterium]
MNLPSTLARFLAHRTAWVHTVVVGLLLAAGLVIAFHMHFASDVLDMLPQNFDSVKVFKTYDREFSQARELTFAVYDESKRCDLDAFTEHFAEELRKEPWVVGVMDAPPQESESAMKDLQMISGPLLFNLPPEEFDAAIASLRPEALTKRIATMREKMAAASGMDEFMLDKDPLGLLARAMKPLAGSSMLNQSRPFTSPDGTLHLLFATTNQTDLGVYACQATMARVEDLKKRVLADWDGEKPEILVTGRTPYVSELSLIMRKDIASTLISSVLLVCGVFWFGFRRVRPLVGIMHVLLICCVLAVALGAFVFHELNMITIGLCSILIGLGVDFGMMLFSIYEAERDAGHDHETAIRAALVAQGRGVTFGAMTSAAAFVCLVLSECPGFAQLGVLIAFGIVFAGLFMMTVFFACIGRNHAPKPHDALRAGGARFVEWTFRRPKQIFLATTALLVALSVLAGFFIFNGRLNFDANPRTLEPANSKAGRTLRLITEKMPAVGEPWIVLLDAANQEQVHDSWEKLQTSWSKLVSAGRLKSAATPMAFALAPSRVHANAAKLVPADLTADRTAFADTIEKEGFNAEAFGPAFAMFDFLIAAAKGAAPALDTDIVHLLPANSPLHFFTDRFFGANPLITVGYITPAHKITSFTEKDDLRHALDVPGINVHYSGWTYTVADLEPWAVHFWNGKLWVLSFTMIGFNVLLLAFLYRRAFPLFALMLSLALSVGAMIASLVLIGASLNLFNVLAFPLVLGVGVDYGIYVVIAMRTHGDLQRSTSLIVKP